LGIWSCVLGLGYLVLCFRSWVLALNCRVQIPILRAAAHSLTVIEPRRWQA